jgi:hypothetical protein
VVRVSVNFGGIFIFLGIFGYLTRIFWNFWLIFRSKNFWIFSDLGFVVWALLQNDDRHNFSTEDKKSTPQIEWYLVQWRQAPKSLLIPQKILTTIALTL